jgi:hypothetical protein
MQIGKIRIQVILIISLMALFLVVMTAMNSSFINSLNLNAINTIQPIDHIVIIVDENKSLSSILNSPKAPYINKIIKSGAIATNYRGITKNPYIALTTGSSTHISNSCNPQITKCQTKVANITDEIESSGRTWKMYAESMPSSCDFKDSKKYTVRHNPFMYFPSISRNNAQCSGQIVPYSKLMSDLDNGTLPNYVFISPNLCNDMHNCPIKTGDTWLSQNVSKILSSSAFTKQNSLLIITWDEGSAKDNKVLTIFLGPAAKIDYTSDEAHNHYSILRMIEYVWNLKPLTKNDSNASNMIEMLK